MVDFTTSELELLDALRLDGEAALGPLFARHHEELRCLIRLRLDLRLQRRLDASDIIQEAFMESRGRLAAYLESPTVPPIAWIRRLARQVVARIQRDNIGTQRRDVRREAYGAFAQIDVDQFSDVFTPPIVRAERRELHALLTRAIDAMSPLEREILVIVHFESRTVREAAAELGINLEAAKKRYRRALGRLRSLVPCPTA